MISTNRGIRIIAKLWLSTCAGKGWHRTIGGSVKDSYDNALAETVIGLYKTEMIQRRGPWLHLDAVELATLEWLDWFNNKRLLEPSGNIPSEKLERVYY